MGVWVLRVLCVQSIRIGVDGACTVVLTRRNRHANSAAVLGLVALGLLLVVYTNLRL